MRTFALVFFIGFSVAAQPISFGVRGGVPLTDAYSAMTMTSGSEFVKTFSQSKEYMVGAMVELRFPFGFSVEADALYHPLNLTQEISTSAGVFSNSVTLHSWEFPILAKYRFLPVPPLKPYIEAGPSFRAKSTAASYLSSSGITVGGGIQLGVANLRIEPELRYTHWGADSMAAIVNGFAPSNVNQVQVSVGLAFWMPTR
jgi:hypothetical protein